MRGIKNIEVFFETIRKEVENGKEIVIYLGNYNINHPDKKNPFIAIIGVFDIMLNYHKMKDELLKKFNFDLASYLERFDIKYKFRFQYEGRAKYSEISLFKDYIEKYDWAVDEILETIIDFDPLKLYFPTMDKNIKDKYSTLFHYYLNKSFSIKQVINILSNVNLSTAKKVFAHIKWNIFARLIQRENKEAEGEALKHLYLRKGHYTGEDYNKLHSIRQMQKEMFEKNFSKKDPEE